MHHFLDRKKDPSTNFYNACGRSFIGSAGPLLLQLAPLLDGWLWTCCRNCDSVLEMWNILRSTFEKKDEFSRTRLNKEFWGFSMERGETVAHTVARLNDIVAQLANNGISVRLDSCSGEDVPEPCAAAED